LHPQALPDHRADDPEELRLLVVVAFFVVGEGDAQGPHRLGVDLDRDADEGQLLLFPRSSLGEHAGSIEEERLPADPGNDHGPAALDHPARDPFADPVADLPRGLCRGSRRRLDHEIARVFVAEDDTSRDGPVALLEDFEDPVEGGFQVQGRAEGLADLQEVGELPDFGGGGGARHQDGPATFRKGAILQIWRARVKREPISKEF
jgi:hypothetical protein